MRPDASRRRLLAVAVCASLPGVALANLPSVLPLALPAANWQRWGSGTLRRFGFKVYEATLWAAGDDPLRPPYALELQYAINIAGERLAEVSVDEMRRLGRGDEATRSQWGSRLKALFPDVKSGERIVGLHVPEGARFYHQGKLLGTIDDPELARAFFAIWLDPNSSAPDVRTALLKRPGG